MNRRACLTICGWLMAPLAFAGDEVVLENSRVRLVIGGDAGWREITDKRSGRNYCLTRQPAPLASVRLAGRTHPASVVERHGVEWTVRFKDTPVTANYRVESRDEWISFRLAGVTGGDVEMIEFLRAPVTITERVGHQLNIAWNDDFAVCVAAANMGTDCEPATRKEAVLLLARAHAQIGFSGPSAALLAGRPADMKPLLRKFAAAFDLPRNEHNGVASKDAPVARGSYWFLGGIGEKDVEKVIACGLKAGVKQVMLLQSCWARTTGHYLFNERNYPNGLAGLKDAVARFHRAGFLVGMHTFVSKVSKSDPYVTPVPDKRFWKDLTSVLAADISANQTDITASAPLADWPASPLCRQKIWEGGVQKHMDAIIDDEIVQYEAIGPDGKHDTFLRCKRGAYGTRAAPHQAGAKIHHFGVDGCINGYIIDQETSLLDEVAERNAAIFNECGFDMVYFDGGEDIPRPHYWHYSTKFQAAAMRRYRRRPIIHMGTVRTHLLWHSFTRTATVDTYLNTLHGAILSGASVENWPTVRQHIDRSVRLVIAAGNNLMPGELGWFGIWPRGRNTDGLQLDEIEYLMVKSLAYNAPISLQTSFSQMEAHPLTPGILDIVRTYEELRAGGRVDEATSRRLQQTGKDFALLQHDGRRDFVEVTAVPTVGGGRDVRAMVGELNGDAVATLWHCIRGGELRVPLRPQRARLLDLAGRPVPFTQHGGKLMVPAAGRRYALICEGVTTSQLRQSLAAATVTSNDARR